ncbi:hypothetical protein D3C73_1594630 [compost metagenome]
MKGFPFLTIVGLVLLGLILVVGFANPESAGQLIGTFILILVIAAGCFLNAKAKAAKHSTSVE